MAPREVAWEVILGRAMWDFCARAWARESVPRVSMARRWIGEVSLVVVWSGFF